MMRYVPILLFSFFVGFASCTQRSAFTCYICKSTVVTDSNGSKTYLNLPDYSKCNIDKSEIDTYQAAHNKVDTPASGVVVDTNTLCSQF